MECISLLSCLPLLLHIRCQTEEGAPALFFNGTNFRWMDSAEDGSNEWRGKGSNYRAVYSARTLACSLTLLLIIVN